MDNGAGAIAEVHLAEVKPVEEEIIESKVEDRIVASLHERKYSDADEVFEDVREGNIDYFTPKAGPPADDFSTDIVVDAVDSMDPSPPEADQISGVSHVAESVQAIPVAGDATSHEEESLDNGQDSLAVDGVDDLLLANVNDKGGTASEKAPTHEEKVINEDNIFATVDNSGSIKEVVTEKLKAVDIGQHENSDRDLSVVSETEDLLEAERVEEKSVQATVVNNISENGDAEEMEPDHDISYYISQTDGLRQQDVENQDLKYIGIVGGNDHLDEAEEEPTLTSGGISVREQNESDRMEAVAGGIEEDTVEFKDTSPGPNVEGQESDAVPDVPPVDVSYENGNVVYNDEACAEPNVRVELLSDEREDGSNVNGDSSAADASFEKSESQCPDTGSSDILTSISGTEDSSSNHIRAADVVDRDAFNHDFAVEHRKEVMVEEEKQKSQASRELENTDILTSISGTENSSSNQIQTADVVDRDPCNHDLDEEHKQEVKVEEQKQKSQGSMEFEKKAVAADASSSGPSSNSTATPSRPAGLGHGVPLLEPTPRAVQQPRANGSVSQVQAQVVEGSANGETEEGDETREKLQMIRVKFLRLAHRLGQTPHNVVVAQVLYRLGLAEQLRGRNGARSGNFSFDRASAMAEQLETTGQEPLDFACTIMVLGKTGVGKSATINSIFDEVKFNTDAFQLGTKRVQDVVGTVQGIKVRVIDTPGLLPSWLDQRQNEKILHSMKRFIKKSPPDIILYLDRLDMQSRDLGDMPLLRTITDIFGPPIWFNAIVVLTHAATAPPDGPNGVASSYEMLVTQRSHVVQNSIRQAAGDMRLMNPVALVENHSACRTNRAGQRVLPNGQVWKPHLLLLSFASKILAEANTLLKLQDTPTGKPFSTRSRAPPLPFLLSSLLQSRPQLKLPEEQFGDDDDSLDDDLDDSSDSEDESEYDELPPFKRLTNAQLAKLTKDQRKAYYDELEYREKLFMKKQMKEEKKRRKLMKKMAAAARDMPGDFLGDAEEESGAAASVPVAMPDLALPASFDADNPTHRYRYLDNSNPWLVRPVLDSHGWDHDVGYEGINVERLFVVENKVPLSVSGQVSKDKKEANVQMEVSSSLKHGEGKATTVGFDMQSAGKDMAYTLRSETKFSNFRHNKATAGLSATVLGDTVSTGLKVEDKLIVNKMFRMVMSGGAMTSRGDVAYGGSLEASLRDKDYPLGRFLATLGLSVMDWHGDLAIGCNLQSQIPIGRSTNLIARGNLNNRGSGQVSIRLNSSEQIQIALIGLIPFIQKFIGQPQQHSYEH